MKVHELITLLQTCDQNAMVVVDGYEGGIYEAKDCSQETIALNVHTSWYEGSHDLDVSMYPDAEKTTAVYLK